jgi:hypothetical protein
LPIRIEPVATRIKHFIQTSTGATLQCAFPDEPHAPSGGPELLSNRGVPRYISLDLVAPEFAASGRPLEQVAFVPMPKTAVRKQNGSLRWKNEVGSARNVAPMKSEPESATMQPPA